MKLVELKNRASLLGNKLPTSDEWRRQMERARNARKWSYARLGKEIGASAPSVREVEIKDFMVSELVPRISIALNIPPPFVAISDRSDMLWLFAGRLLRRSHERVFDKLIELCETLTGTTVDPYPPE